MLSTARKTFLLLICTVWAAASAGRTGTTNRLVEGLHYDLQFQMSFADGNTPLWLNANKYGLSSLESTNGYVRAAVERPLSEDAGRKWGIGYGVDFALPYNYTSDIVVQQAFVEARWLHGTLTIGSKEQSMMLKNNLLSSGSQTLGRNARPVPQVRLALPDYFTLPFTGGWLHLKGHIAYGKYTDSEWQKDFTSMQSRYTEGLLYHSKAGYLKIGKDEARYSFSVELGLEMAAQFGGTSYIPNADGTVTVYENSSSLKAYWNAFIPGGSDVTDASYKNTEGNHLGSWLMRLNWDADTWRLGIYADKYFEDHSSMFQMDYDGYGDGDEWNTKKKSRYLLYDFKDIMLGAELNLKRFRPVSDIVFEYIYTKYQSGPIYHDHTSSVSDHIGGNDNYYNHGLLGGWQHWGQVMGNPLYRSPIYNDDGTIRVGNNRFTAFHLGIDGKPSECISYRLLASWQDGLGTYDDPYKDTEHNLSVMLEATYMPQGSLLKGWSLTGALGMDTGDILGDNFGLQVTVGKTGAIDFKKKKKR